MDSVYWVISRDCNQRCAHCYNDSEPGAPGLALDDLAPCIANLPPPSDVPLHRIIVSGGEVLVWPDLLFAALRGLHDRYSAATQLWVQTNGDLLCDEFFTTHAPDMLHAGGANERNSQVCQRHCVPTSKRSR